VSPVHRVSGVKSTSSFGCLQGFLRVCRALLCVFVSVLLCVVGSTGSLECLNSFFVGMKGSFECFEGFFKCMKGSFGCIKGCFGCIEGYFGGTKGSCECGTGVFDCIGVY